MKKVFAVVLALSLGLAVSAYAADSAGTNVQVKENTVTKDGVTTTKTVVKDPAAGTKTKTETVTAGTTTLTKEQIKAKGVDVKKEELTTKTGDMGIAKVNVKKGAINDLQIEWNYAQVGTEYITEYTIKDKTNPALMKELNLTPVQTALLTPGTHKIVSTSPFTGEDIRNDIRSAIVKDIQNKVNKKK